MSRLKPLLSTLPPPQPPAEHGRNLHEFTLFPKLPPEVRDMIWAIAASEPRMVKLIVGKGSRADTARILDVPGQSRHPAMIHTCRESRAVGLKAYNSVAGFSRRPVGRGTDFVNFAVDRFRLQIPSGHSRPMTHIQEFNFSLEEIRKIQHVDVVPFFGASDSYYFNFQLFHDSKLLLENANIASVRFTYWNKNSAARGPINSVYEAKACLETNMAHSAFVKNFSPLLPKTALPKMEFHWKTTDDTGLWPCAPRTCMLRVIGGKVCILGEAEKIRV
ncbi:hypothetical protein N431DRAFT_473564 [Stipitochalara longipes BDJ]|nr:hypothetical protein N431DRAFT_473564 [Stipitochalara longipes BDJ]